MLLQPQLIWQQWCCLTDQSRVQEPSIWLYKNGKITVKLKSRTFFQIKQQNFLLSFKAKREKFACAALTLWDGFLHFFPHNFVHPIAKTFHSSLYFTRWLKPTTNSLGLFVLKWSSLFIVILKKYCYYKTDSSGHLMLVNRCGLFTIMKYYIISLLLLKKHALINSNDKKSKLGLFFSSFVSFFHLTSSRSLTWQRVAP